MSDLKYNPTVFSVRDIASFKLIQRSPDIGDGWRQVSDILWPHFSDLRAELVERDQENKRLRFTARGLIIMDYIV
jgi:uncharacterized protein (DUF736 family)